MTPSVAAIGHQASTLAALGGASAVRRCLRVRDHPTNSATAVGVLPVVEIRSHGTTRSLPWPTTPTSTAFMCGLVAE
jgi:hypothetical protein